ncbi:hypothetical protein HID58_044002 [Brassica napus]|uniref:Kinesin-like protein n=1 Tax=Brassica napus TaxID=3708 RepID=A0A816RXA8_BRANA|nr:hypothetical protein HID58_044002 [Brassica napus]CAF2078567.1 unnamed protein product [Brassica napus]
MSSSNGRWLQSTGLPHFQPSPNDYGYYGGGQGVRGYQNAQRNDFFGEPTTPQYGSRPSSQRRNNGESEFSPGLLDLHSFDTEIPVSTQLDGPSMFNPSQSQSFDDFEAYNKQQPNRSRALADNLAAEKEKMNAVAKIKVVVRKRPLNKKESVKNEEDIIDTQMVDLTAYVEKHEFVFNAVLDEEVSTARIEATCFAYGQTGSGKKPPLPLKASRDILRKLCMREDGKHQVCIVGLQEYRVSDTDAIVELIERGSATRSTGTTGANEESSRSHAEGNQSKPPRLVGKLSFIDLAGSERGADTTDNDKQTRLEGAEINKSLLALKECIRALDNDQGHIPFRGLFHGELSYCDDILHISKLWIVPRKFLYLPHFLLLHPTMNEMWNEENDDFDASDYEQEKQTWKKNVKPEVSYAPERIQKPNIPMKSRDMPRPDMKKSNSDDNLNALLQEEELVNAHHKQVEDAMNIVKEEMNLLVEADQPGNHLDSYISRLNTILSQKAAGTLQLQNRLAHFQKRLRENNVLVSTTTGC